MIDLNAILDSLPDDTPISVMRDIRGAWQVADSQAQSKRSREISEKLNWLIEAMAKDAWTKEHAIQHLTEIKRQIYMGSL